ncbi:MAG: hypothetical protein C0518_12240 [Opitutus sp.]|nr:hypothetical protein [Opitutus sp.]
MGPLPLFPRGPGRAVSPVPRVSLNWTRLNTRLRAAGRFASSGERIRDRWTLFRAGLARYRPFDDHSVYSRLGRLGGLNITPRLRCAGGQRVALNLAEVTDLIVFEELFVEQIYPLGEVPFTPDAIVDVGACAGFFTLLAHARFPAAHCHTFEPQPDNLLRLRTNFALNGLSANVLPCAAGLSSGSARFIGHGFGGHLVARNEPGSIEVPVRDSRTGSFPVAKTKLPARNTPNTSSCAPRP